MDKQQISASDLVGPWRLAAFSEYDERGVALGSPLGRDPRGWLCYGADGWVSVHIGRTDGEPSPEVYLGYTGTWELIGDQVLHHVEIAADPTWPGTTQVRDVSFSGDQLVLARSWTVDGRPRRARLAWQR